MDAHEAPGDSAAAEPLGAFVIVSFLERTPVGTRFSKHAWPLHVTLVRFDAPYSAALIACGRAIASGGVGIRLRIGDDADFGFRGRVRVSLVEPEPSLQELHERILAEVQTMVRDEGGRVHSPQHTGAGFRPHVSIQGERRVHRGDELVLTDVALVDMAPDGDSSLRAVVAAWGNGT